MTWDETGDDLPHGLGQPARRALASAGFMRLDQVAAVGDAEVLKLHGVGPRGLTVLRRALAERDRPLPPNDGASGRDPAD